MLIAIIIIIIIIIITVITVVIIVINIIRFDIACPLRPVAFDGRKKTKR